MKVLVIIPAYNESENIVNTINDLKENGQNKNYQLDYVIINDGSTDNTKDVCLENDFNVINLVHNLGIGGCVQTGYLYALRNNYDIAIQFDGDNQHDASFIPNLIMPIINGEADMTIGSRYVSNLSEFKSSKARQLGIKWLSLVLRMLTGEKIYDMTSGFRAINKEIMELFSKDYPNDYPEPETIVTVIKEGYQIEEIPVRMRERKYGKSSITPLKSVYYMTKVTYAMIVRNIIDGGKK